MYDGFLGGLVRRYGWRKVQICSWVVAATGILITIPLILFPGLASTFLSGILAYSGGILFLLAISTAILIPNRRRRYTVFDVALVNPSSEDALQVEEQPVPDTARLELPADIDTVTRKPIAYLAVLLLFGILLWLFIVWHDFFVLVILLLVVGVLVAGFVRDRSLVSGFDFGNQRIRINEEGIVVSTDRAKQQVLYWNAVRVFAFTQEKRYLQSAVKCYMLSSGYSEVRWEHRLRTHWYSMTAPTTSDEVYNQQMEALLSYIAARTGLPLLDMR